MTTATLSVTPWAHQAMSLDEMAEISRRLVDLHARASVMSSRHRWTIRVESWAKDASQTPVHQVVRHHQFGHLADLIHGAVSEYERAFAYSPDELVTIASQAGIAVARA